MSKTNKTPRRKRALRLASRGWTVSEIARELGESPQLVRYWMLAAGLRPNRVRVIFRGAR